jgi:hypothetical protein
LYLEKGVPASGAEGLAGLVDAEAADAVLCTAVGRMAFVDHYVGHSVGQTDVLGTGCSKQVDRGRVGTRL